jgi:hypothetical protein
LKDESFDGGSKDDVGVEGTKCDEEKVEVDEGRDDIRKDSGPAFWMEG